jgi:hypothetical protein
MKRIVVRDAKPGMLLARPITDQQGRIIVAEGTKLSQLYISRLEKWGVAELFVAEEAPAPRVATAEPGPAAAPAKAAAAPPAAAAVPAEPPRAEVARSETPAAGRPGLPPGVYRGADLPERLAQTFSRVEDDPLMAALHGAVRRRLLTGQEGK